MSYLHYDIYEIETIEPSDNSVCFGCGARHRPLQFMRKHGDFGRFCTAQFSCDEDREFTPVCVYCNQHFVPEAHRYCSKAPTFDGITAHSIVDRWPEKREQMERDRLRNELKKKLEAKKAEAELWLKSQESKELAHFVGNELQEMGGKFVKLGENAEDLAEALNKIEGLMKKRVPGEPTEPAALEEEEPPLTFNIDLKLGVDQYRDYYRQQEIYNQNFYENGYDPYSDPFMQPKNWFDDLLREQKKKQ